MFYHWIIWQVDCASNHPLNMDSFGWVLRAAMLTGQLGNGLHETNEG